MEQNNNWSWGVGGVVIRNNEILLVRHTYGSAIGQLLIPGGYVRNNEMLEAAVAREILEETGVTAMVRNMIGIRFQPKNWYAVFVLEYISGEPKSDGIENDFVEFIPIEEALERNDITKMSRMIIQAVADGVSSIPLNEYYSGNIRNDYMIYGLFSEDKNFEDESEVQKEIGYYSSLPVMFNDFIDVPQLTDGEIELVCVAKKPGVPEKKWVPAYSFEIRKDGNRIGDIGLRIGYTVGLYYGGQIGYGVDKSFRGHGYAEKACRLLTPVIKAHVMTKVLITNNQANIASKRTCEKLGAKLLRVARLPEWHDLYKEGRRFQNIYEWII